MNTQKMHKKPRLPLVCKLIFVLTAISVLLYVGFRFSADFADAFNRTVSPVGRIVMAKLTGWIPFSFAEMLLILSPVILITAIVIGVKYHCNTRRQMWIYLACVFCVVCMVFNLFVWNMAPAYSAHSLDQKLNLERKPVSAEELAHTADILLEELKKLEDDILFMETGSSRMPYSYTEMNTLLMQAYDKACEKYDFIDNYHSKVKPVMLSEPMSYTHITGIYTFFTGEANINVNFPDYTIPYTAAHELAHQRGIAREDEANFVAFLVCMESDDHYIRYSAYLNLYEYVSNALYSANRDAHTSVYYKLPYGAMTDMAAYSKFFKKYQKTVVSDVSGAVNDTFLNINGVEEGSKSYGMVVDLTVAYFKEQDLIPR